MLQNILHRDLSVRLRNENAENFVSIFQSQWLDRWQFYLLVLVDLPKLIGNQHLFLAVFRCDCLCLLVKMNLVSLNELVNRSYLNRLLTMIVQADHFT